MKATTGQQQLLLKFYELQLEERRTRRALQELTERTALREMEAELLVSSQVLLNAQERYEKLEVEIARVLTDLELVEARIARDEARMPSLSSAKEVDTVKSELLALEKRKELLETAELELLETRDAAGLEVTETKKLREELNVKIAKLNKVADVEIGKLQSKVSNLQVEQAATAGQLPAELMAAYERKAVRSVPIGRLVDRSCGACGIGLTASVYDDVRATPEDELPTCSNCEAFLVR
mgnify:CR=1 FL=1